MIIAACLFFGECFFHQVSRNDFFLEGVSTCLLRFHGTDHFREALSVTFFQRSNYFLCHVLLRYGLDDIFFVLRR